MFLFAITKEFESLALGIVEWHGALKPGKR